MESEDVVVNALCAERRKVILDKIDNMEERVVFTVKITGAVIAIVVTLVQLGLHFFG